MFDINIFDSTTIYILLFMLIFINGLINFPSSQIVYLGLGYATTIKDNNLSILYLIIIGAVANTISNFILHFIIKNNNVFLFKYINKLLKIDKDKLEHYKKIAEKKGFIWFILGKITPGVKVFIPILTGLLDMNNWKSFFIFLIGSTIWATMFLSIGYFFGDKVDLFYFSIIVLFVYILISLYFTLKYRKDLFKNVK